MGIILFMGIILLMGIILFMGMIHYFISEKQPRRLLQTGQNMTVSVQVGTAFLFAIPKPIMFSGRPGNNQLA
jgi:hypothetical protein